MKKNNQNWKELLENKVIAPLFIGCVIGGVGYVFETEALIYIGSGLMAYGFFRMLYDG